ncbi:Ig-like domain-containing protein [Hymenobacter jejuensis]|uniref:T9SS type A sorting domain-containing protein n=1 Tax=Hymenobacter jejuensis TaxID=2502781 RepID=A0A5B7ZVK6_9BACT|nr:Ig-like domain-containing protein [Hymenobacter jejuensis]QDA58887.1 T9SS type A sorting domain-containing protein [Hymenobacter jejuensis]
MKKLVSQLPHYGSVMAMLLILLMGPVAQQAHSQSPNVTYSGPITITKGGTYSGNWESQDSKTAAVKIETSEPVIIENSVIRSRGHLVMSMLNGDVTIRNTRGYGLTPNVSGYSPGRFFESAKVKNVRLEHNYMEQTAGIYIAGYAGDRSTNQSVKVLYNQARNIDGRFPGTTRGAFAQFIQLNSAQGVRGMEIGWNEVINTANNSFVEDNINIFKSNGTSDSPLLIHDNLIQGSYPVVATDPGHTGGGIMLGDGNPTSLVDASGFIKCYSNQIIGTTHYGVAVANGHDIEVFDNRVVSGGYLANGQYLQSSNVGMFSVNSVDNNVNVSDTFFNISFHDNQVGYVKTSVYNGRNDFWFRNIHTNVNNKGITGTISLQTEKDEYASWLTKVSNKAITLGPLAANTVAQAPANQAPTVALTPTVSGTTVSLSAKAADADGTVAKVEFFQNGTKLGETTTAPYAFTWANAPAGTYSFTARATDNAGAATTSAAVSAQVAAPAPTLVALRAADNPSNIVNGLAYSYHEGTWTGLPDFNSQAIVKQGTVSTFDLSPRNRNDNFGFRYTGYIEVPTDGEYTFYTSSDDGSQLFIGSQLVVDNNGIHAAQERGGAIGLKAGKHALTVTFFENSGEETLAVSYQGPGVSKQTVPASALFRAATATPAPTPTPAPVNQAPTVALTPTVSGTTVSLSAKAADADGTVAKVEFFQNGTKLGETTTAPYAFTWANAPAGTYSFTARATDNAGAATTSAAVSAQVAAPIAVITNKFYRALNLGGSALTIDGNKWEAGSGAANVQLTGGFFSAQNVPLTPSTDAARAQMIRSSLWSKNPVVQMSSVPNGTYDVYVYVWEDNFSQTFSMMINGQTVANYTSGSAGKWSKLGPFATNVTNGVIRITTTGGDANLSGVEVITKASTSGLTTTDIKTAGVTASATAYPNPFVNKVTVATDVKAAETMGVTLINQMGREVYRTSLAVNSGLAQNSLDLSSVDLPTGQYYLRFTSGSMTGKTIKLVK